MVLPRYPDFPVWAFKALTFISFAAAVVGFALSLPVGTWVFRSNLPSTTAIWQSKSDLIAMEQTTIQHWNDDVWFWVRLDSVNSPYIVAIKANCTTPVRHIVGIYQGNPLTRLVDSASRTYVETMLNKTTFSQSDDVCVKLGYPPFGRSVIR